MLTNEVERSIEDVKRTQKVRLIADLLIFAPYLVYLSTKQKLSPTDKTILVVVAGVTIVYNTKNFFKNRNNG